MIKLSKRLEWIAEEVPAGSKLADIGSDHALLPSFLAEQGKIISGVAGEVNEGPFEAALKQVHSAGLEQIIDVRKGDGLAVLSPGEVNVITIAGMGGALIASILEAGKVKLTGANRLVLQPNVGEAAVRSWLLDHDWVLIRERILEEDGKTYEILTAERPATARKTNSQLYEPVVLPGDISVDQDLLIQLGPYLIQESSPIWFKKWRHELDKLEMICRSLSSSTSDTSRQKEIDIRQEIKRIEEVLAACSQKAKPSFN